MQNKNKLNLNYRLFLIMPSLFSLHFPEEAKSEN